MKGGFALLLGWMAGIFTAATVVLFAALVLERGRIPTAAAVPRLLMEVVAAAGPGLGILSVVAAARLRQKHAAGAPRGATLALGALGGGVLGVPAVFLMPLIFIGPQILQGFLQPGRSPETLFLVVLGALSGAALGLACAWVVSKPEKA